MNRFLITMLIFIILVVLVIVVLYTDLFSLKEIEIDSYLLSDVEVEVISGLERGKNLFFLDTDKIYENLKKDARIETVVVTKKYPSTLQIRINEREPFAMVSFQGKNLVLDQTARVIQITDKDFNLIEISGFEISRAMVGDHLSTKDSELFMEALNLIQLISQTDLKDIVVSYEDSQVVLYIEEKLKVRFGRVGEVEKQFSSFMALYERLVEDGMDKGIIDVTNSSAPVYKPFE